MDAFCPTRTFRRLASAIAALLASLIRLGLPALARDEPRRPAGPHVRVIA